MYKWLTTCSILTYIISSTWAGDGAATIKSISARPQYVRPFATIVGTMTNSGWFQTSSLEKDFRFSVSLPLSLVYLNNRDRHYDSSYIDEGCQMCREQEEAGAAVDCGNCVECREFIAPTIFGTVRKPSVYHSFIDMRYNVVHQLPIDTLFIDGADELNGISVLPFITLQAAFSFYYTEIKLRYIGIPSINGNTFQFPGIGVQHDFHHFFPSLPVSLSLAANFTLLSTKITPGGDFEGTLHTGGLSHFLGVLTGYKVKDFLEIFLEAGWDHNFIKVTGDIISNEDGYRELIPVDNKINGRNSFRAALNFAFPLGYHPVIGGIGGAQFGNTINIISFRSKKRK